MSTSDSKITTHFNPPSRNRLGKVVPDHFQETKISLGEVQQDTYHVIPAVYADAQIDLADQSLMADQLRILDKLRRLQDD